MRQRVAVQLGGQRGDHVGAGQHAGNRGEARDLEADAAPAVGGQERPVQERLFVFREENLGVGTHHVVVEICGRRRRGRIEETGERVLQDQPLQERHLAAFQVPSRCDLVRPHQAHGQKSKIKEEKAIATLQPARLL